jgi:predicted nuclease of predicted toxin-antitoxin system
MLFLADMGISMSTVKWLKSKKHDVIHVREIGMQTTSDDAILARARDEKRIVLTCDLDFWFFNGRFRW